MQSQLLGRKNSKFKNLMLSVLGCINMSPSQPKLPCCLRVIGVYVLGDELLLTYSAYFPCRMVRFWSIGDDCPVQVAPLSNGLCCAFSTDGSVLAAGTHDGSVYFWATPRQVSSLQHLCRMSIRRVMPTQEVQKLPVPSKMLEFLSYRV